MENFDRLKESCRRIEAFLFASSESIHIDVLEGIVIEGVSVAEVIDSLKDFYRDTYIDIIECNNHYKFHVDMTFQVLQEEQHETRVKKIDGSALQALSVIAFHQPITYQDINGILPNPITRKVLDRLLNLNLISINMRKESAGRALTYVTTQEFLDGFGLNDISDLMDPEEVCDMFKEVNAPTPLELNRK